MRKSLFAAKLFSLVTVLAMFVGLVGSANVSAADIRTNYDYRTFKDGKYFIQSTVLGDAVYNNEGEMVISPGRYFRSDYLGSDLFVVNRISDPGNASTYSYREMGTPILYNAKTGKATKMKLNFLSNVEGIDVLVHPFNSGYARVENGAFYEWTTLTYYQFIDKKGKSIGQEVPYSFCTDMITSGGKQYYFTVGDELSVSSGTNRNATKELTKRDLSGKAIKTVTLPGVPEKVTLVKSGSSYYIKVTMYETDKNGNDTVKYYLYTSNLTKVSAAKASQAKIKAMKAYDPVGTVYSHGEDDIYYENPCNGKLNSLGHDWVFITPQATDATSFDVANGSMDGYAWVMLYYTQTKYLNNWNYDLDINYKNQAFFIEPVGKDDNGNMQARIWAGNSGRQLRSYFDKDYNITVLAQGALGDTNSKGNVIKEQIFTIIENKDGSVSFKDCNGKYLTMSYGSTESGTALVFADYANGDSKQKYKLTALSDIYEMY